MPSLRYSAIAFVCLLLPAAAPAAPRPYDLGKIAFLAGRWSVHPRNPASPSVDAIGGIVYRWHPGDSWLGFDLTSVIPGIGRYEVSGGVSFDPDARAYVAYSANSLSPRVVEYQGRWQGEARLVFDSVDKRPKHSRVEYVRNKDGTVVFSASESADGRSYHPYFEALLRRIAEPDTARALTGTTDASSLESLALAIRDADYRGDRAELKRLSGVLARPEHLFGADANYWLAFARWRRAINGFNETPMPEDLREDLEAATQSFRAALEKRPDWIEAKIGIVGAQSNLLFLSQGDTTRTRKILAEYVPMFREIAKQGAENPRALWLVGGAQLGAPPPYGGDAAKAAATLRRGVEAGRRETRRGDAPPLAPAWGTAENLMNLAYLHSHSALENRELALAYAEGALAAVPHWHYVADILLPQILALKSTAP